MAITTAGASYPLESFGPNPPFPNGDGGYQLGAGNSAEPLFRVIPAPATATATATLTTAQLLNGLILGSPGTSATAYTLPLAADLDAALPSAVKVGASFDFSIVNVNGSSSGAITVTTNTGWSIGSAGSQGNMVLAATAGTTQRYRARKTGTAAWSLYQIA